MEKKLLYINKRPDAAEKIRRVKACAVLQRVKLLSVQPEEWEALPEDAELMKLSGFGKELQPFLQALRRAGVRVDYKCIETESNRDWPLQKLYQELKEEHERMQELQGREEDGRK